jgi:hypothetical protein
VWVVAPAIFLGPLWVACVALQAAVIGALLVLSNFTRP